MASLAKRSACYKKAFHLVTAARKGLCPPMVGQGSGVPCPSSTFDDRSTNKRWVTGVNPVTASDEFGSLEARRLAGRVGGGSSLKNGSAG